MKDTLQETRADIRGFAVDAFKDHRVVSVEATPAVRVFRCATPGTGVYAFTVVLLPRTVVFYGDIGEAILRMSDPDPLCWLRGAVHSEGYVIEKFRPQPAEEFYRSDAHAWLDEWKKDADPELHADEEAAIRSVLRDEESTPEEFARALSDANLLDGDLPGMGPDSATLWIIEGLRWFAAHAEQVAR